MSQDSLINSETHETLTNYGTGLFNNSTQFCICCLKENGPFISLTECAHADFLNMMAISYDIGHIKNISCQECHNILVKINKFKLQVQESYNCLFKKIPYKLGKKRIFTTTTILHHDVPAIPISNDTELQNADENLAKIKNIKNESETLDRNTTSLASYNLKSMSDVSLQMTTGDLNKESNVVLPETINNMDVISVKIKKEIEDNETLSINEDIDENEVIHEKIFPLEIKKELEVTFEDDYDEAVLQDIKTNSLPGDNKNDATEDQEVNIQHSRPEDMLNYIIPIIERTEQLPNIANNLRMDNSTTLTDNIYLTTLNVMLDRKRYDRTTSSSPAASKKTTTSRIPEVTETNNVYKTLTIYKNSQYSIQNIKKPYKCDICEKLFSVKGQLIIHNRLHTGEKPFKCDICEKCFGRKIVLKKHYVLHTKEKRYECDICHRHFTHTCEKSYKCKLCGKRFQNKTGLLLHRRIHTGDKAFKCDICDKCFVSKQNLQSHMQVHNPKKTFKCDVCEKCFSRSGGFKRHILTHTSEKPYKCDVCEKCYSRKYDLQQHSRVHSGERPYKCNICEKSFHRRSVLEVHKLYTHS